MLGGGMQGRVVAANLAARPQTTRVTLADLRPPLGPRPEKVAHATVDALDAGQVARACAGADAVVTALPSGVGKAGLAHAVATGRPVVDVSFTAETVTDLDDDARRSGTVAVVDTGVAPGLSHVLAGAAHHDLGGLDALRILVGGIPVDPPPVFRHAVYFNPEDLVAEYFRPARMRRGGADLAPMPLEAPVETFDDPETGRHEAFPTDGLRSLLRSYPDVPDMVELTLRKPGHLDLMRALRDLGLLDTHAVAEGAEPPVVATARALGARYAADAHPDYLLMVVEGRRGDRARRWRLLDRRQGEVSAMGRTTGFTAAAVATLLARGRFRVPGVHPPERLGRDASLVRELLADLAAFGVRVEAQA